MLRKGSLFCFGGQQGQKQDESLRIPAPPIPLHLSRFLRAGTCAHAHMHVETKRQTLVLFFRHYPYFILFFEMGAHLTSWPKLTTQTMLDGQ